MKTPCLLRGVGGDQILTIAFGDNYDRPLLDSILTHWDNGDFSNLPEIEVISSDILGNANGGYSQQTNTIYLADEFVNNAQPYTIEGVILEEIGHYIDAQINTVDPIWDEGAVFADLTLTPPTPLTLRERGVGGVRVPEDDSATITIAGQEVAIKMSAGIVYVNANSIAINPDGSSWATAYPYLTDAIASSVRGEQIWVAKGVYYPDEGTGRTDNSTSQFFIMKHGVAIYGGFAGTETSLTQRNWSTNPTILSGDIDKNDTNTDGNNIAEQVSDIQGSNAKSIVKNSNIDGTAVLDGVVITAGKKLSLTDSSPSISDGGGGMVNLSSSPTISNVTFSGNSATYYGGGMVNLSSSPTISNVTFSGNSASYGGGMINSDSSPTISNVTFSGNSANYGGGMYNSYGSSPTISNVTFSGNSANIFGGGMNNSTESSPTISNVTFSGNSASEGGGMFNSYGSSPTISNTIIWGNTTRYWGQISNHNNDFYNPCNPYITYSLIQNAFSGGSWDSSLGTNGGHNLDSNPLFVNAANGDLRLKYGSPAIDVGKNSALPQDMADLDKDGNTTEPIPFDLAGNPRIQNTTIDLGAFERGVLTINDVQLIEGQNTSAILTVSINSSSSQTIKVNYNTEDGTALAGSDYTSKTGTLTFKPGETSKTITIPIVNNDISEPDETFKVNLSNPVNVAIGDGQGVVTISDTVVSAITKALTIGVENLTLTGTANINGTGNANNNLITGNSGNNILKGGLGIDSLIGGLGNDIYIVDNIGDKVTEKAAQGTDLIKSSVSYTLPVNVENLSLLGTDNLTAMGNNLANKLTGNAGNNELSGSNGSDVLTGGLGNDVLTGGLGTDTLTGGKGQDTFVYLSPTEGKDTITDFNRAQGDKININRTGFKLTNLTAGALQIDRFVLGTAAKDEGDRFIFNSATNTLFFDQDGTGSGFQQREIAIISNDLNLKASDIILV